MLCSLGSGARIYVDLVMQDGDEFWYSSCISFCLVVALLSVAARCFTNITVSDTVGHADFRQPSLVDDCRKSAFERNSWSSGLNTSMVAFKIL